MWLITDFGFFSVVEKEGQAGTGMLTIRSRVRGDLEALRNKYLPELGPIEADAGTDYEYRAVTPAHLVAAAFSRAISDIGYSNFKRSVAREQGPRRSRIYHGVWEVLRRLAGEDGAAK